MKITTLIIDDERAARNNLRRGLEDNPLIELAGEAEDGPSAVALIEEKNPQLILLDIQMPAMDGFDVLRALAPECPPAVIFVTAYDEYAIEAFEVSAVDYLLKPFSEERLREAIDKVATRIEGPWSATIQGLLRSLPNTEYVRQLPVHAQKRIILLDVDSISHIVSEQRVIYIYDQEGNGYWTNETLDQLQKRLDPEQFFRIHRSSLINLKSQFEIEPWDEAASCDAPAR
ncbi:MAG: response regulator transcription factor [Deltaproteobacteria bacterium]|nr:response regulator transcription factor [Deltaproteobacteria bacterium]